MSQHLPDRFVVFRIGPLLCEVKKSQFLQKSDINKDLQNDKANANGNEEKSLFSEASDQKAAEQLTTEKEAAVEQQHKEAITERD